MRDIVLGRTGMQVKAIGFGGIPIQRVEPQEAVKIVQRALELGINFFDTARAYTTSEAIIGQALGRQRARVYIATKTQARTPERAAADLTTSLENLHTDYIDLYQLHNVVGDEELARVTAPGGVVDFLREQQARGAIRYLGITSHRLETAVKAARLGIFDTIQVPFNYIEDAALQELYPLARAKNLGIIVMKPLAGGAITHSGAALRWCLDQAPGVVIPGVASIAELETNLQAASVPLTPADIAALEQDKNELGPTFCRRCRYCMPCPNNIDINFIVTAELFFNRGGWGRLTQKHIEQLTAGLACEQCGDCEEKCPYHLPLTEMVKPTAERLLARIKELGLTPLA